MLENESNDSMLIEALLNQHFHKMTHAGIYSEENVIAPPEFALLPMLAHDVHRDGRTNKPTAPLDLAASCHRRIARDETRAGHPTTAAILGQRNN